MWDVFLSYATEDKEAVVRPLADLLQKAGLRVWIDEAELRLGDSLREQIDNGLRDSRFGLVVLSHSFFSKDWPKRELNALLALESSHRKRILPIWHGLDFDDVRQYSPILADRLAVRTSRGIAQVAKEVLGAMKGRLSARNTRDAAGDIDVAGLNAKVARYLQTKRDPYANYITFHHDADAVRRGLAEIPEPSDWREEYHRYLGETAFISQNYFEAADSYESLRKITGNNSYALAVVSSLACGLATDSAVDRAERLFSSALSSVSPDKAFNLRGVLDAAISFLFGELFGLRNPLLLVYGNDEGRLRDNLERSCDALFRGMVSAMAISDEKSIASLAHAFGQTLIGLAVPLTAKRFLTHATDGGVDVSNELSYADELVKFGYENARIASLRTGERLPVNADMTTEVRHRRAISRLSAIFGKYIDDTDFATESFEADP